MGACGRESGTGERRQRIGRVASIAVRFHGDGDKDGEAAAVAQRLKPDEDGDGDNEGRAHYDFDDGNVFYYGHPASSRERQAIVAVVRRYYAAVMRVDGVEACAAMTSTLARATTRQYGQGSGSLALSGHTCATVTSQLFGRLREQVSAERVRLTVGVVRVEGNTADAVLNFGEGEWPRLYTRLRRQRGDWRIDMLQEVEIP
jgi:hypothetical protein